MHGKGERKGASQERGPSPQERAAQQTRPHCWPLGAGRPWALLGWGGRAGVGAEPLPAGRSSELLLCGPRGAQGVGAMDGRPHERGDPCGRGWCKVARVGAQPGGERHGGARCLGAGSESSPPLRWGQAHAAEPPGAPPCSAEQAERPPCRALESWPRQLRERTCGEELQVSFPGGNSKSKNKKTT